MTFLQWLQNNRPDLIPFYSTEDGEPVLNAWTAYAYQDYLQAISIPASTPPDPLSAFLATLSADQREIYDNMESPENRATFLTQRGFRGFVPIGMDWTGHSLYLFNGYVVKALEYTGDAYAHLPYDEQIRLSMQWHPSVQQLYDSAVRGPDGRLYVLAKQEYATLNVIHTSGDVVTDVLDDYAVAIASMGFGAIMAAHAAATAAVSAADSVGAADSIANADDFFNYTEFTPDAPLEVYDYSMDAMDYNFPETAPEVSTPSTPSTPSIDPPRVPADTRLPDWMPDIKVPELNMNTAKQIIGAVQTARAIAAGSGGTQQRPPFTQRVSVTPPASDPSVSTTPTAAPFLAIGAALLAVLALR